MQLAAILHSLLILTFVTESGTGDGWIVRQQIGEISIFAQFELNAEDLAAEAESLRREISAELGLPIPQASITLVLFRGRRDYEEFVDKNIPSGRGRRALFVHTNGKSAVYAFRSRNLRQDLRHELTHAWLRSGLDFLPLWIDEGLVRDFFENTTEPQDFSSVRWKARLGWKPSLASLEDIQTAAEMDGADYASSWAWVTFLLNESNTSRSEFTTYLSRIHQGEVPERFSSQLRVSMPDAKARLGRFFRKATLKSVVPAKAD